MASILKHVTLICLVIVLTGCSVLSTDEQSPDAKKDAEPVNLTIGYDSTLYLLSRVALDDLVRQFEERYPHVTVQVDSHVSYYAADGFDPSRLEGVDIFWSTGIDNILLEAGLLLDISHLSLPEYDPLIMVAAEPYAYHDGKRYLVPVLFEPVQLAIFEEALRQANLRIPDQQWTYDEFEELARALADRGQQVAISTAKFFIPTLGAYGGGFYNSALGRWTIDTPENRAALVYLKRLADEGMLTVGRGTPSGTVYRSQGTTLLEGPALGMAMRMFSYRNLTQVPLPKGPAGRGADIWPYGPVVLSNSPHPEEAAAFIQLLMSEEGQSILARHGYRPVVPYPSALETWRSQVGGQTAERLEAALSGNIMAPWPRTEVNIIDEVNRYLGGELLLDELLDDLKRRLSDASWGATAGLERQDYYGTLP